jgi:hypothetical protein
MGRRFSVFEVGELEQKGRPGRGSRDVWKGKGRWSRTSQMRLVGCGCGCVQSEDVCGTRLG